VTLTLCLSRCIYVTAVADAMSISLSMNKRHQPNVVQCL